MASVISFLFDLEIFRLVTAFLEIWLTSDILQIDSFWVLLIGEKKSILTDVDLDKSSNRFVR